MSYKKSKAGWGRNWATEKEAKKLMRKVYKAEDKKSTEMNFSDENPSVIADYTGDVNSLTDVIQGTGDEKREGDKIMPINIRFSQVVNGETYSGVIRTIIFRWKEFSIPVVDDILYTSGSVNGVLSPYSHDKRSKFVVLMDKVQQVSNNGGAELAILNKTFKLAQQQIEYVGASTTGGKNSIYSLVITDRALVTSPSVYQYARLNFTDK